MREEMRRRRAESEFSEVEFKAMAEYALLVPDPKGGKLSLEHFPFQAEPLYSDEIAAVEEACFPKSTQVGASTGLIRWAMREVDQFGLTVIYFFPTDVHVREFSDERIEPSIQMSEYLQRRIPEGHVRQKGKKQIGSGWLNLRGVASKNAVQSVDADALVFDEYDECDPANLAQAERRISGALAAGRRPKIRRAGRPSVPGYGIDAEWEESDKRCWIVTCPECDHQQILTWEENMRWRTEAGGRRKMRPGRDTFETKKDVSEAWRVCARCEESLEPKKGQEFGPIHAGRWKAQRPGPGRVPGYHLQRLIVPRTDLRQIVRASRLTGVGQMEQFYNADLGVAWMSEDAALSDAQIDLACGMGNPMVDGYRGRFPVTAGLDMASERDLTIRISEIGEDGKRRGLYLGEPENIEQVVQLMNRFNVHVLVADSMPERRTAKALAAEFPGRVFLCVYDLKPQADAVRYDPIKNLVHVNRTEGIDAMMDSIRDLENLPPSNPPGNYKAQMKAPKRRVEEDSKGRPVKRYVSTGTSGDDYAHAEVYDLTALEMLRMIHMVQEMRAEGDERVVNEDAYSGIPDPYDYDPGFGGTG